MRSGTRGFFRLLSVGALLLVVAGLAVWRLDTASGQQATVRIVAPTSVSLGATSFEVRIEVQGVPPPAPGCETSDDVGLCGLASYEWELVYDPAIIELLGEGLAGSVANCSDGADNEGDTLVDLRDTDCPSDSGFLGSTGRMLPQCFLFLPPSLGLQPGHVRFGCGTIGATPLAPGGGGLLSTVAFRPLTAGSATIGLAVTTGLADTWGAAIPAALEGACVVVGTGSCAAPTPLPTATPPGATPTPGEPAATPTPTGPIPTPTPLPPGLEAVPLVAGCNPVTSTYPNDTPIQTLADRVGPAGNLVSLWKFDLGTWRAFSPQYPQVSDLTGADLLDVVFACVEGVGDFVRPIV